MAQVKGFLLCDNVKTDVVLLVADDSAAWAGLKAEFDIRTSESVTNWMGEIEQPRHGVKRNVRPAWRAWLCTPTERWPSIASTPKSSAGR